MERTRCPGCMGAKQQHPVCELCGHDERTANLPHQLPVGSTLQSRYQVGRVLGQGGFGITYIGYDLYLDTPVAIKEYYPNGVVIRDCTHSLSVTAIEGEYSNFYAENRQRFFREAKALARFAEVPNIVHIQNLFLENNTAYIVMEYLKGVTLKDYVAKKGGKLSEGETFALLQPVMTALKTVHDAGIVHRDISPDNIMLLPDGRAKLLDFGAVREVHGADADKPLTQSTEAILKHGFAPIEQYQRRGGLGPWTDVYAMCATIYYCLTGRVPADAPLRVMGEAEVDWNAVPGLTAQQRATLTAGMTLAPKQRIPNMAALTQGLFQDTPTQPREYSSGTVALGADAQPYTAPLSQNEVRTAPLSREQVHTAPAAPYTAPVDRTMHTEAVSQPKPKRALPKWVLPGAIAVLAAVVSMALLSPEKEPDPQLSLPTAETLPPKQADVDPLEYTMKGRAASSTTDYAGIDLSGVETLAFLDTAEDAPGDAVDVSYLDNGKVLAWINEAESTLYIAAEGGVYAPSDSSYLFHNVGDIQFNDAFRTDNVVNMSHMFDGCTATELDLSCFNTEKVTDMSTMFLSLNLETLSLSGWDTANVNNMSEMFYLCSSLKKLDLSHFDTSRVTSMSNMFQNCESLQELDLSSFNTARVTDMSYMFAGCSNLDSLDLSGFDTVQVTTMFGMFNGCTDLESLDLSSFDTSNVAKFAFMFYNTEQLINVNADFDFSRAKFGEYQFMDEGDTFNGRPWEELFQ